MVFRWYGESDPVRLERVAQIPAVRGIVSALYDVAVGDPWPRASLERRGDRVSAAGLRLAVIESIPVHEEGVAKPAPARVTRR